MATTQVHNPLFARAFNRFVGLMEREVGEQRAELVDGLSGRVVEIGAGNGINFRRYPDSVEEVLAFEPESFLRGKAEESASEAPVTVRVADAVADSLPLDDASADAAVACLVLCTVPEQQAALAELRRVLAPGGELRFMEHIRGTGRKARVQGFLDRSGIWPRMAGGCHCSRDTVAAIEAAGFEVEQVRDFTLGPSWGHTNPHVIGVARASASGSSPAI